MGSNRSPNTVWHHATVTRQRREEANKHRAVILWFTGLSGAGKSTLAHAVEEELHRRGCRTFVLDGDNVRHGLCSDLGFSEEDRQENIRRIGEMSKLFNEGDNWPFLRILMLTIEICANCQSCADSCHTFEGSGRNPIYSASGDLTRHPKCMLASWYVMS